MQQNLPNTFFTEPPHWTWLIVLYFFIGGIAGGSFFIASILYLFGRPVDRPLVRLGYYVAFVGAVISGILLIIDLDRPLRFWHMLFESETGRLMFKYWAPMSVGAWGLLIFGAFATLAAIGAATEDRRFGWEPAGNLVRGALGTVVAIVGGISGFFLAGYTGVLLAVTNRPVWADSSWLGILFLFSAASTAAATLILLSRRRAVDGGSVGRLAQFDKWALILELVVLVIFLITLGGAASVFLRGFWWGLLLVLGVIVLGILLPLAMGLGWRTRFGWLSRLDDRPATAAVLVLIGGFLLRVVTIMSSEGMRVVGNRVVGP